MFYSIQQAESACDGDPSLIFSLIRENDMEVVNKIINKENFDFNVIDEEGNNVLMCLLKHKKYDLVLNYIDRVDINYQNKDGDTLSHLLMGINYVHVRPIIDKVLSNRRIILNIKNNNGETILDKSININYLYTTIKILEQKRFNSIDIYSFNNLYKAYIKNSDYGKYSKLSNLEIILDNLENKPLLPTMKKLINLINTNMDIIKNDFNLSKTDNLDNIINLVITDCLN